MLIVCKNNFELIWTKAFVAAVYYKETNVEIDYGDNEFILEEDLDLVNTTKTYTIRKNYNTNNQERYFVLLQRSLGYVEKDKDRLFFMYMIEDILNLPKQTSWSDKSDLILSLFTTDLSDEYILFGNYYTNRITHSSSVKFKDILLERGKVLSSYLFLHKSKESLEKIMNKIYVKLLNR